MKDAKNRLVLAFVGRFLRVTYRFFRETLLVVHDCQPIASAKPRGQKSAYPASYCSCVLTVPRL